MAVLAPWSLMFIPSAGILKNITHYLFPLLSAVIAATAAVAPTTTAVSPYCLTAIATANAASQNTM